MPNKNHVMSIIVSLFTGTHYCEWLFYLTGELTLIKYYTKAIGLKFLTPLPLTKW